MYRFSHPRLGQPIELPPLGPVLTSTVNIFFDRGSALQLQELMEGRRLYPIGFEIAFKDADTGADLARREGLSLERRVDLVETSPEIIDQQLDAIPPRRSIDLTPMLVGAGADVLHDMGYDIEFSPSSLEGTAAEFKGSAIQFEARLVEVGKFPWGWGIGLGLAAIAGILIAAKGGGSA